MAGVVWTLAALEAHWPAVPWRKPVPVKAPDGRRFCCRICVAQRGLKAEEILEVGFESEAEAQRHIDGHAA